MAVGPVIKVDLVEEALIILRWLAGNLSASVEATKWRCRVRPEIAPMSDSGRPSG
jgi:hypothetical protein